MRKLSVKPLIQTAVSNERLNLSNPQNVYIVPRYVLVVSQCDISTGTPFPREPIACIDCDNDLSHRTDWEPIMHRGEQTAMCSACIALRYDACAGQCENPILDYTRPILDYARVQNTRVVEPLFPDGPVYVDSMETPTGYRVMSPEDIAEYYSRNEDPEVETVL